MWLECRFSGGMARYLPHVHAACKGDGSASHEVCRIETSASMLAAVYLLAHIPMSAFAIYFLLMTPRFVFNSIGTVIAGMFVVVLLVSLFVIARSTRDIVIRRSLCLRVGSSRDVRSEGKIGAFVVWSKSVPSSSRVVIVSAYVGALFLVGLKKNITQKMWVVGIRDGSTIRPIMASTDHDKALSWYHEVNSKLKLPKDHAVGRIQIPLGVVSFAPLL